MITTEDVEAAWAQVQAEMQASPTLLQHLYLDKKMNVARIARHTGLHRTTVARRLEAAKIRVIADNAGRPRQTECWAGHDLATNTRPTKDGGRSGCLECKRIRERVT